MSHFSFVGHAVGHSTVHCGFPLASFVQTDPSLQVPEKVFVMYLYIVHRHTYNIYDFNYVCFRKLYTLPWSPHEHERVVPFLKQIGADFFVEVPVHADAVPHLQTLLVASQVGAPGFPKQVDCEPAAPSPQTIKIYTNQHIHTPKFIHIIR